MAEVKVIEVVGGIIFRDGKYLLGRRPAGKSLGGHWEFIGGKIEIGETPEQALSRECMEEIALPIVNERVRTSVTHAYPDRTIHLTLIDCEPATGAEPKALEHEEIRWCSPEEVRHLDLCPADLELLPVVFPPVFHFCHTSTDELVEKKGVRGVLALCCTTCVPLRSKHKLEMVLQSDFGWEIYRVCGTDCVIFYHARRQDPELLEEGLALAKLFGIRNLAMTHLIGIGAQEQVDRVGRWVLENIRGLSLTDVYFADKTEGDFDDCHNPLCKNPGTAMF